MGKAPVHEIMQYNIRVSTLHDFQWGIPWVIEGSNLSFELHSFQWKFPLEVCPMVRDYEQGHVHFFH